MQRSALPFLKAQVEQNPLQDTNQTYEVTWDVAEALCLELDPIDTVKAPASCVYQVKKCGSRISWKLCESLPPVLPYHTSPMLALLLVA